MRRTCLVLALLALPLLAAAPASAAPPPIKHVFVIVLENKGFDQTFGPQSPAPYLSQQLTQQGELLTQYYATGHASLDNYITMVSGQAPAIVTQADCPFYFDLLPGIVGPGGQAIGQGCV
jgi:phosphatidylinositol-3-phosphatase